ncbi:MAG: SDR family oxidoreductase [Nitrososphaerota archaeon]|nr:SDR family oxidoreductase [Nitrososphaerota archaeon]
MYICTSLDLKGRTALITGASRRIGRAIATRMAKDGADIILHYMSSADEATSLREDLTKRGVRATLLKADLSTPEGIDQVLSFSKSYGRDIDVLINNASVFKKTTLWKEEDIPSMAPVLQANALAPYLLTVGLAEGAGLKRVINITDALAWLQRRKGYAYSLSKDLLTHITYALALDLAPGVTVNAVAPGPILPPEGKDYKYLDRVAGTVPLKVHGGPADVVNAIMFLLASDYITGQVIYVDGGAHLLKEGII